MDFRELRTWEKPELPKKAILNPNYLSLPSEWDSSVSQIEMLQRLLWNVNQVINVLTLYAENMDELQAEYEDIFSKYNSLRDELIEMINDYEGSIDTWLEEQEERINLEIARMEERFRELDETYRGLVTDEIDKYTQHMILFGLTEDGHFLVQYSDNWDGLTFNTTGYDIDVPIQPNFGHLVLSY